MITVGVSIRNTDQNSKEIRNQKMGQKQAHQEDNPSSQEVSETRRPGARDFHVLVPGPGCPPRMSDRRQRAMGRARRGGRRATGMGASESEGTTSTEEMQ